MVNFMLDRHSLETFHSQFPRITSPIGVAQGNPRRTLHIPRVSGDTHASLTHGGGAPGFNNLRIDEVEQAVIGLLPQFAHGDIHDTETKANPYLGSSHPNGTGALTHGLHQVNKKIPDLLINQLHRAAGKLQERVGVLQYRASRHGSE